MQSFQKGQKRFVAKKSGTKKGKGGAKVWDQKLRRGRRLLRRVKSPDSKSILIRRCRAHMREENSTPPGMWLTLGGLLGKRGRPALQRRRTIPKEKSISTADSPIRENKGSHRTRKRGARVGKKEVFVSVGDEICLVARPERMLNGKIRRGITR